ncbi:putative nucleotidyltransferase, ribonuclease H [Tanacetum coccineum]
MTSGMVQWNLQVYVGRVDRWMLYPKVFHLFEMKRSLLSLKRIAFRSAATPFTRRDWIKHMEKLFSFGCPDKLQDSSCCIFKHRETVMHSNAGGKGHSPLSRRGSLDWLVLVESVGRCQRQARQFQVGDKEVGQTRSTETLPLPPLCTTCGKPHPGMGLCYGLRDQAAQDLVEFVPRLDKVILYNSEGECMIVTSHAACMSHGRLELEIETLLVPSPEVSHYRFAERDERLYRINQLCSSELDHVLRLGGLLCCLCDFNLYSRGSGDSVARMRIAINSCQPSHKRQRGQRLCVPNDRDSAEKGFMKKLLFSITNHRSIIEHQEMYVCYQPLEIPNVEMSAHFLPSEENYGIRSIPWTAFYRQEIVRCMVHQTLLLSKRSEVFSLVFGKDYRKLGETRLKVQVQAFHPQTDGQSERTIQTLEDMLRACALEWTGSWDEYLCLVEFAYNNSWHASIKAAPFELLYGRKCRAPICWDEVGERLIEGPELIEITNEKVAVAKEKLKEARSRQKSYADKHRRDLEFQVGDRVFLKVSPFRGVKRFGIKGKLSPRFIGPFEILERIGEVSYRLALPPQLSHVHDVFHVSLLRGYHYHPLHVASYPFDQIQPDMSLSEEPESILDRQERVMRNKVIPFVKILWKNHPEREATWETEESMRASYPHFFV